MQTSIIAAFAAFTAALIALTIYHVAFAAPALQRAASALAQRLSSLEEAQAQLGRLTERAETRLRELDALSRNDTGSELSYALALLNREGDGVVLSSIYSRTDTRTFGFGRRADCHCTSTGGVEGRARR